MLINEQLIYAINKEYPSEILISLNTLVQEDDDNLSLVIGKIANILSSNDIFPKEDIINILKKNLDIKSTYNELSNLNCNHIPQVEPDLLLDDE